MRILKWVPIILCLLLMALAGTVVVYARTLTVSPVTSFPAIGLDVCAGKWCLLKITPGITTYSEAKEVLADNITRDEDTHFHGRWESFDLRVEKGWDGSGIGTINIQGSSSKPFALRLGQLVEQFGLPCYVTDVSPNYRGVGLAFPAFTVWIQADQDRISLSSPVNSISLVDDSNLDVGNRSCSGTAGAYPWRGFASLHMYQR